MPDEKTEETPLILGKYAGEPALDEGLNELAKQVGVPLGSYADLKAKEAAYSALSNIARIKRESEKATPQSNLGEPKPKEEDDGPFDFFKVAGVDAAKFAREDPLGDADIEGFSKAMQAAMKSPRTVKELAAGFQQVVNRAVKSEAELQKQNMRIAAREVTGLSDGDLNSLLSKRAELLGDDAESRAIEKALTSVTDPDVVVLGVKNLFERAKTKGIFGTTTNTPAPEKLIRGTQPANGNGKILMSPADAESLKARMMSGDKAAIAQWQNIEIKR